MASRPRSYRFLLCRCHVLIRGNYQGRHRVEWYLTARGHEEIRRFDIAMNNALLVRCIEAIGNLNCEIKRNKLQIDLRCPDADRFEGNTQPSVLIPQRLFRISKARRLIGTSLRPSGVLLSGTKIVWLFQSKFSIRIRKSSRSFLIPVSRISARMSRKSSLVRARHLQRRLARTSFCSALASSVTSRPCSFNNLIFGARAISFHSSALRSIRLRVRSAQLALPAEPENLNLSASSVVISVSRILKTGVGFNKRQPLR